MCPSAAVVAVPLMSGDPELLLICKTMGQIFSAWVGSSMARDRGRLTAVSQTGWTALDSGVRLGHLVDRGRPEGGPDVLSQAESDTPAAITTCW